MFKATKVEELYYILIIVRKAPKRFRYLLCADLTKLCLSAIEKIYRTNEIFVRIAGIIKCSDYQIGVLTDVKMFGYIAVLAVI